MLFTARFALSYACRLLAHPLAGWLGATAGLPAAARALAVTAAAGAVAALWPGRPAIRGASSTAIPTCRRTIRIGRAGEHKPGRRHAHAFVVDTLHFTWPHGR